MPLDPTGGVVSAFSVEAASRLDGPAWLADLRTAAAERFASATLPTPQEEIWRYSRIDELDLSRYRLAGDGAIEGDVPLTPPIPDAAAVVTVVDGRSMVQVAPAWADRGLRVGPPSPALLGSVLGASDDVFVDLNTAFASDPLAVEVPPGLVVDRPIVVHHHIATDGLAVMPRLVVVTGDDSQVTVLDWYSSGPVDALAVPVVEIAVGAASRLRYVAVNRLGLGVWQIGRHALRAERDSTSVLGYVGLGGDYARLRAGARLVGPGASCDQIAVYFGEAGQMHDVRTLQDHVAPRTRSDLLFKGAVEGQARSVYSGLIHVGKDAAGTNAFQTNRNLTLSDGAWAESVPNLAIETNDVRCSHASSVGPIDEDQLFYLESRGVPPDVAERLIVLGFFEEVLDRIGIPEVLGELRTEVAAKLARRDG